MTITPERDSSLIDVLLVDTFSSHNDFTSELVAALAEKVRLTVFTVENTRVDRSLPVRLLALFPGHYGKGSWFTRAYKTLKSSASLASELWAHRRGVVHVQFFRNALLEGAVYFLLRPYIKHLVFTAHNVMPHEGARWHRHFYRAWYSVVDHVHVLSAYASATLQRSMKVPEHKIVVIPHGNYNRLWNALNSPAGSDVRKLLGIPEGRTLVLFFGFLRGYKGVERAVAAMRQLPQDSKVLLVVVGEGSKEFVRDIENFVNEQGVTDRVMLNAKHVSNQELSMYLRAADLVVFPYRHIYQSGALILALTFGKAIIASDIEGLREYVRNGETGVLCDTSDSVAFASAIARIEGDGAMRRRLGENAQRYASEVLDWERIAACMVALYKSDPLQRSI